MFCSGCEKKLKESEIRVGCYIPPFGNPKPFFFCDDCRKVHIIARYTKPLPVEEVTEEESKEITEEIRNTFIKDGEKYIYN